MIFLEQEAWNLGMGDIEHFKFHGSMIPREYIGVFHMFVSISKTIEIRSYKHFKVVRGFFMLLLVGNRPVN